MAEVQRLYEISLTLRKSACQLTGEDVDDVRELLSNKPFALLSYKSLVL